MVTHDPNVARRGDRILRIEDGAIKAALTPAQTLESTASISYVDQLKSRLTDIDAQLEKLDQDFRADMISGDEYAEQRQRLKLTKASLLDELHRMGVVI